MNEKNERPEYLAGENSPSQSAPKNQFRRRAVRKPTFSRPIAEATPQGAPSLSDDADAIDEFLSLPRTPAESDEQPVVQSADEILTAPADPREEPAEAPAASSEPVLSSPAGGEEEEEIPAEDTPRAPVLIVSDYEHELPKESEPSEEEEEEPEKNEEEKAEQEKLPFSIVLFDWTKTFLLSLISVIFIFTLLFRGVTVDGDSMKETLHDKDYLIVSDLFYTPKTGDIVVVQSETYHNGEESLIKRVIATGGQTVRIDFNIWEVRVDGEVLDEPYILRQSGRSMEAESMQTENGVTEFVVEEGRLFVMGDNRNNSLDSRSNAVGLIDVRNVMGRVILRVYPFSDFGTVD